MDSLHIALFGNFHFSRDGGTHEASLTHTIQALLAFLLLNRHRTYPRELLAGVFWGDSPEARARSCLNTAVWRLRRALEPDGVPPGTYLVSTSFGELGFNERSNHWLDVAVFEEQIQQIMSRKPDDVSPADILNLEQAIGLYTGELLEGHYSDWVLQERERLRYCYLNCLNYLMQYHQVHSDYEKSLSYGRLILGVDPLYEDVHRQMMRLYLKNGQRALAIRQYESCRDILRLEIDIEPMAETNLLYKEILQGSASRLASPEPGSLQNALEQLSQAMAHLEQAKSDLEHASLVVRRLIEDK